MGKKVLLVVDMLHDFINENGSLNCGQQGRDIVPMVVQKIREYVDNRLPVIFIMDAHDPRDQEFKRFPVHCIYGTRGARLIDEIENVIKEYSFAVKVPKSRYSGFFGTNLNNILKDLDPEIVEVVGVCTNICVLYTVEELCNRNYKVVVYRDGVASFDQDAHLWALKQMESVLGAEIRRIFQHGRF